MTDTVRPAPLTASRRSVLLAMIPDTGERYLSSFLLDGLNDGSDDEWLASLDG